MPQRTTLVRWGFEIEPKARTAPLIHQVHGTQIVEDTASAKNVPDADAIFTTQKGKEVFVFTADCLPVLLFGENDQAPVMAVHVGWRGAKSGIVRQALEKMRPLSPRITAVLGPCLGRCCFEVKEDFISEFVQSRGNIERFLFNVNGKPHFDLVKFVTEEELKGLQGEVVTTDLRCTYCSTPALPSYRRNKGTDPRIRSWIIRESIEELSRTD